MLRRDGSFDRTASQNHLSCDIDEDTMWLDGKKIRIMGCDTPEAQLTSAGVREQCN